MFFSPQIDRKVFAKTGKSDGSRQTIAPKFDPMAGLCSDLSAIKEVIIVMKMFITLING
jgi:hypothetical protein